MTEFMTGVCVGILAASAYWCYLTYRRKPAPKRYGRQGAIDHYEDGEDPK